MVKPLVVIKYGGNAMVQPGLIETVLANIAALHAAGTQVVLVHGGGPYIQGLLDKLGLKSEFVGGHRRTDAMAIGYINMVLCGQVNGDIVARLNRAGCRAIGISGRDAGMAVAVPRQHATRDDGEEYACDLGFVGDIEHIDPRLIKDLLVAGYLPVVAPISTGPEGLDYNVNADMFAGHLAAALHADEYIVLTDVDGLRRDIDDPATLIDGLTADQVAPLLGNTIAGGMIPKVQSCLIAVRDGVGRARIINGTKPECLIPALAGESHGTVIRKN